MPSKTTDRFAAATPKGVAIELRRLCRLSAPSAQLRRYMCGMPAEMAAGAAAHVNRWLELLDSSDVAYLMDAADIAAHKRANLRALSLLTSRRASA